MKAMSMVGLVGLAVMGICAQASMEAGGVLVCNSVS